MAAAGGSQCGYCTPGFVDEPVRRTVSAATARALRPAGARGQPLPLHRLSADPRRGALARPAAGRTVSSIVSSGRRRRSSAFDVDGFSQAATVDECLALLRDDPTREARRRRRPTSASSRTCAARRWPHLVSLEAIDELREFSSDDRARHALAPRFRSPTSAAAGTTRRRSCREWLALFASPLIRNRATLGGNLATASPIGDAAPLLLALDASCTSPARPAAGTIPLASFFTGYRKTALAAGRDCSRPSRFRSRCRSSSASTRSPSGGSTTSARSPRRWRSIVDQHGDVSARAVRVRRRRGDAAARRRGRSAPSSVSRGTTRRSSGCSAMLDRTLHADERSSRLDGLPPRGVEEPGREILVGVAGMNDRRARRFRTRAPAATSPARRSTPTTSAAGFRTCCTRGRCCAPHAHARVTATRRVAGARGAGRRHGADRRRRAGRGRHRARRATTSRCFRPRCMFHGQPVAWVLGETLEAAQRGAARVAVELRAAARHPHDRAGHRGRQLSHRAASARRAATSSPLDASPLRVEGELGDRRAGAFLSRDAGGHRVARRDRRHRGRTRRRSIRPRRRRSSRACSACRAIR